MKKEPLFDRVKRQFKRQCRQDVLSTIVEDILYKARRNGGKVDPSTGLFLAIFATRQKGERLGRLEKKFLALHNLYPNS